MMIVLEFSAFGMLKRERLFGTLAIPLVVMSMARYSRPMIARFLRAVGMVSLSCGMLLLELRFAALTILIMSIMSSSPTMDDLSPRQAGITLRVYGMSKRVKKSANLWDIAIWLMGLVCPLMTAIF